MALLNFSSAAVTQNLRDNYIAHMRKMQLQILYPINTSAGTSSPHVHFGSGAVKSLAQGLCVLMGWMSISFSEADMCTVLWIIAHELLQNSVGLHSEQITPFIWQTLKKRERKRERGK